MFWYRPAQLAACYSAFSKISNAEPIVPKHHNSPLTLMPIDMNLLIGHGSQAWGSQSQLRLQPLYICTYT